MLILLTDLIGDPLVCNLYHCIADHLFSVHIAALENLGDFIFTEAVVLDVEHGVVDFEVELLPCLAERPVTRCFKGHWIYLAPGDQYDYEKADALLNEKGYAVSLKVVSDIMHKNGWFPVRSCAPKQDP